MKKRLIKIGYGLAFFVIGLAWMYYIVFYTTHIFKSGLQQPFGDYIVPYNNHGHVVYITILQKLSVDWFPGVLVLFLMFWLVLGTILQDKYDIKFFPNYKSKR